MPISLPIGAEQDFEGIVDLIQMKSMHFVGDHGMEVQLGEIPADLKDKVEEYQCRTGGSGSGGGR